MVATVFCLPVDGDSEGVGNIVVPVCDVVGGVGDGDDDDDDGDGVGDGVGDGDSDGDDDMIEGDISSLLCCIN